MVSGISSVLLKAHSLTSCSRSAQTLAQGENLGQKDWGCPAPTMGQT